MIMFHVNLQGCMTKIIIWVLSYLVEMAIRTVRQNLDMGFLDFSSYVLLAGFCRKLKGICPIFSEKHNLLSLNSHAITKTGGKFIISMEPRKAIVKKTPKKRTFILLMVEIRRPPVEVGSWTPIIYRVSYISGAGFEPSTVASPVSIADFFQILEKQPLSSQKNL